jgi:hypothetical protein
MPTKKRPRRDVPSQLRALRRRTDALKVRLDTWAEFNAAAGNRFHQIEEWLMKIEKRLEKLES